MKKRIDFRLEEKELELLEAYCNMTGRTKTEVLRELVRSLEEKMGKKKGG